MCFGLGGSRRRDKYYEEDMYHSRPATPYNRDRSPVRAEYYRRDEFDRRYSTVDNNPRLSSYLTVPEEHRHHHHREQHHHHEHHGHHHRGGHEHSHHEHHGHGHHHHHNSGREGERERIIYTTTSATNLNGYGSGSRRDHGYGSYGGESSYIPTLETRVSERELAPPGLSYGHTAERLVVPGYSRENSRHGHHGHGYGEVVGREEGRVVTTSTTAVSASARRGSAF
ncbi:hypothetical protein QBC37DRAFT_370454 [Rhypophila decipiens]|uniref:Uncharacterized protein n=1 Tax=Rhypophila decipiens TaxID=261697 RepID=A0AAN7BAX6_9PEZI|nr:hypothetical protein QBC37DRAFT_370454 [Rhypophila decipiens]